MLIGELGTLGCLGVRGGDLLHRSALNAAVASESGDIRGDAPHERTARTKPGARWASGAGKTMRPRHAAQMHGQPVTWRKKADCWVVRVAFFICCSNFAPRVRWVGDAWTASVRRSSAKGNKYFFVGRRWMLPEKGGSRVVKWLRARF